MTNRDEPTLATAAPMSASDVMAAVFEAIERQDLEAMLGWVSPDVAYDWMPRQTVHGHEGMRSILAPWVEGSQGVRWIIHRHVSDGAVVVTERSDRFLMDGNVIEVPVVSVVEVHHNAVTAWRDYVDPASVDSRPEYPGWDAR